MTSGRAKKPEGDEGRADARRHVQRRRAVAVEAFHVSRTEVREAQAASRERHDDLTGVEVPGEDQVERALGNAPHDAREMTEEDAEVGGRVGALSRAGLVARVGPWIDSDDLDAATANLDLGRLVEEERDAFEPVELVPVDPLRERIAAVREVVVAEDDDAARAAVASSRSSSGSPSRRETRSPVRKTSSGLRSTTQATASSAARRPRAGDTEMEIREVRYADAVELPRCAFELHLENPLAEPPRLEPPPREGAERDDPRRHDDPGQHRPRLNRRPRCEGLSDAELLDHRLDRDDVPLELELGVVEPGGDADELREVEDRHAEVAAGLLAKLRLPGIEGEVAERARRHDRVGTRLGGLLDRLDQLAERDVLARLDDREAAALDLRRVVDRGRRRTPR